MTTENITQLVFRIQEGTRKIWEAQQYVNKLSEGGDKEKRQQKIDDALDRLHSLNDQVVAAGYVKCYFAGNTTPFCYACPIPHGKWDRDECPAMREER